MNKLFILVVVLIWVNPVFAGGEVRETIFEDSFESGNLTTKNWNVSGVVNWTVVNTDPMSGNYHAQAHQTDNGGSYMNVGINTYPYLNISFRYYRKLIGLDIVDDFSAEWFNGSVWIVIEQLGSESANDAEYVYRNFSLPSEAGRNPDFKIRFMCNCDSVSEYCRVDNVSVIGVLPQDIHFWVFDAFGSPIPDISFTLLNFSNNVFLWNDSSDASGFALYQSTVLTNLSIYVVFPDYSAVLSNVSGDPIVYINDWVSGRVRLSNTLGSLLEDQDCSVVAYEHNSSILIHDYDTRCRAGSFFVDRHGDWVSVGNCSLTDSGGWYFFKGRVDECMGFEYDQVYDLVFTCNRQTANFSFTTSFEKSPLDMRKTEDFIRNYSGLFIIYGFFSFLCLLVLIIITFVLLIRKS